MPDSPRLQEAVAGRFVTLQLMPSLRQLLATHAPLLLLDAASTRVQVGWLRSEQQSQWAEAEGEAGIALFEALGALHAEPATAGAFVFCDGPGSILGVRTTAMTVRSWCVLQERPVFAYHSLALVAHALGDAGMTVIADARRDSWHCASMASPLRRVATAELPGRVAMPEGFRTWTPPPPEVRRTSYALAALLPSVLEVDLFRPTTSPDAFLHEEPSYVTWTPQIHRAP